MNEETKNIKTCLAENFHAVMKWRMNEKQKQEGPIL